MQFLKNTLALSAIGMMLGAAANAEKATPITTIVCKDAGGSTTLDENVYAYTFDTTSASETRYLTVYLGGSHFNQLLYDEYFVSASYACSLSGMNGTALEGVTIQSVTASGVGIDVDGGSLSEDGITQQYTVVTFSAVTIYIGPSRTKASPRKNTLSPEQAKALEAFRARGFALPKQ